MYLSDSAFNLLDQTKTASGDYIDLEKFKEIIVLPDEVIGNVKGDKVGFVGDLYEAIALFRKREVAWQWMSHVVYGYSVAVANNFDVKIVDEAAGYYVTFTM